MPDQHLVKLNMEKKKYWKLQNASWDCMTGVKKWNQLSLQINYWLHLVALTPAKQRSKALCRVKQSIQSDNRFSILSPI